MSGSSQYKFGVLAKIVKHLKTLHQVGGDHPLSLDEILDETNQLDVGSKITQVIHQDESKCVNFTYKRRMVTVVKARSPLE